MLLYIIIIMILNMIKKSGRWLNRTKKGARKGLFNLHILAVLLNKILSSLVSLPTETLNTELYKTVTLNLERQF